MQCGWSDKDCGLTPGRLQVVLDCRVLHCSGPNLSRHWRRAWMPQFSRGVIRDAASSEAMAFAVPVADAAAWAGLDGSQERMGM